MHLLFSTSGLINSDFCTYNTPYSLIFVLNIRSSSVISLMVFSWTCFSEQWISDSKRRLVSTNSRRRSLHNRRYWHSGMEIKVFNYYKSTQSDVLCWKTCLTLKVLVFGNPVDHQCGWRWASVRNLSLHNLYLHMYFYHVSSGRSWRTF